MALIASSVVILIAFVTATVDRKSSAVLDS
jgi:hypothetical protein